MSECEILSIQVGMPKVYQSPSASDDGEGNTWESGIFKSAVTGPVWLGDSSLVGDGQADLVHHGGLDRALLIYSAMHYPEWNVQFGCELEFGSFGENLTVTQVDEHSVCLGDRWISDEIEVEVSQPRLPCFKLARRLNSPGLNVQVMANRKGGWYTRTIQKGNVQSGQALRLVSRPHPTWTIDRCFQVYATEKKNQDLIRELLDLPQLSTLWKDSLLRRLSNLGA